MKEMGLIVKQSLMLWWPVKIIVKLKMKVREKRKTALCAWSAFIS